LKRWLSSVWIPLVAFAVLLLHGAIIGLTDDEAYYWALAQRPSWGFAYHPPAVVWLISMVQWLFGWIFGNASPGLVRLPAALLSAGILALGLRWIRLVSGDVVGGVGRSAIVLLGYAGLFAVSWMMVPDLPLLFGFMLAFVAAWELCFGKASFKNYCLLGIGVGLSILSKFSGVLVAASAFLAVLFWSKDRRVIWRTFLVVAVAAVLAALPSLIWNASHGWAAILYQFRDRHSGGGISLARYGKFWASQLLFAGPALLLYAGVLVRRSFHYGEDIRPLRYALLWAGVHGVVYLFQPLRGDFKPHWAFIVWLPLVLVLAHRWSRSLDRAWAFAHAGYGWCLVVLGMSFCHVPLTSWLAEVANGKALDARMDVTNDLYGWSDLKAYLAELSPVELPVIGSRYQTSGQAAFALGDIGRVSLIPRELSQRDEWPDLGVTEGLGPLWPRLIKPVLYIADNRYDQAPVFPNADCRKLGRLEKRRWHYTAKWIDVWRCDPR
jgi:4-amino-4-deoxy-L-arabinose transferase-like glycosyltransferase